MTAAMSTTTTMMSHHMRSVSSLSGPNDSDPPVALGALTGGSL